MSTVASAGDWVREGNKGLGACPKHVWGPLRVTTGPFSHSSQNVQDKRLRRCTSLIQNRTKKRNVSPELVRTSGTGTREDSEHAGFLSQSNCEHRREVTGSWEFTLPPARLEIWTKAGNSVWKSLGNRSSQSTSPELNKGRKGQDGGSGQCSQKWDPPGLSQGDISWGLRNKSKMPGPSPGLGLSPAPPEGEKTRLSQQLPSLTGNNSCGEGHTRGSWGAQGHRVVGCMCKHTTTTAKRVNRQEAGLRQRAWQQGGTHKLPQILHESWDPRRNINPTAGGIEVIIGETTATGDEENWGKQLQCENETLTAAHLINTRNSKQQRTHDWQSQARRGESVRSPRWFWEEERDRR